MSEPQESGAPQRRRPTVTPSTTTAPFWAATAEERFLLQRCVRCGGAQFYPRATCSHCGATDLGWEEISGEATVHTFTVARRATHPKLAPYVPYVIAIVELAEGPRVTTNLVDCDVDAVTVGMPVRLCWDEPQADGLRLPLFRPA